MNTHDIDLPDLPPCFEVLTDRTHSEIRAYALAAIEAYRKRKGEVVVTKTPEGEIIAVTRQDDEGRILSVIAEADSKRRGEPVAWIRVDGDRVIASRCKWIYPQSTDDYAGTRDERRYAAIGGRDGDIVFNTNLAETDLDDLMTMLAWQVSPQPAEPVKCAGCEGKPAPGNNPCAVCGKESEPVKVPSDEDILEIAKNPISCPCSPWWLKHGVKTGDVRQAAIVFARSLLAHYGKGSP